MPSRARLGGHDGPAVDVCALEAWRREEDGLAAACSAAARARAVCVCAGGRTPLALAARADAVLTCTRRRVAECGRARAEPAQVAERAVAEANDDAARVGPGVLDAAEVVCAREGVLRVRWGESRVAREGVEAVLARGGDEEERGRGREREVDDGRGGRVPLRAGG